MATAKPKSTTRNKQPPAVQTKPAAMSTQGSRPLTIPPIRWIATLTYRSNQGIQVIERRMSEMSELHYLVEGGPNFCLLISAVVLPNSEHFSRPVIEAGYRL